MKVKLYLSKQGYHSKPDKAAGIIKMEASYDLVEIEPHELYEKLSNGHFMHHECGSSVSNNGSGVYTFKKALLKQAQAMCIDMDYKLKDTKNTGEVVEKQYTPEQMPEWSDELLGDLKYKNVSGKDIDISPTFWIESFSAHKVSDKKIVGNSVHLFYVFEDPIYSTNDYEKTCVSIIYAIYNALKAKGYDIPLDKIHCPFDPVSTDMFQGLWGSYDKRHGWTGKTYFWDEWSNSYKKEYKDFIFEVNKDVTEEATEEDIKRTIEAYATVKTIEDIDISKSRYLKYKQYFGHEEGFHIISSLKYLYSQLEEGVNSKQSLCYQVCRKLLLGHCNDFFDMDEQHFYNEYKRCKTYQKNGKASYMTHIIKLIGDTGAIPMIQYKQEEPIYDNTIKLSKTQYLSDKQDDILGMLKKECINFLIAKPGLGKTVFAQKLPGKSLIIELFNSIIKSEEKFSSEIWTKYCEDKYIGDTIKSNHNVCSANKFVSWVENHCSGEQCAGFYGQDMFDNIILDESHLLCLSNYRYEIMGETIRCLKKLKAEHPDINVILMTGTPFGESMIFDTLNTINIKAEPRYDKTFHMIQTSSIVGYMKELIKTSLKEGLRVFIPVDSETWFDTFIDTLVEDGIIEKERCYYFNQPKSNEDIEINILNTKEIGDITILGTSSYMSVGIDLEDWRTGFVTIIPWGASASGNFSGIEVEQFANRHRKQNLEVYYVIPKSIEKDKKPTVCSSCKALLSVKNDILKAMYHTNPIFIKMPMYLVKGDELTVNEDMFNVFVFYKDMKPIISSPAIIYEYMESNGWKCEWAICDHTERGIDVKEHKEREKIKGTGEFMKLMETWANDNYPAINVKSSIQDTFEITENKTKWDLFSIDSLDVGFTNYYAKNVLFGELLSMREWLTGQGSYNLVMDAYDGKKINMTFIERTLLAIKLYITFDETGLWKEMSMRLGEFYDGKSIGKANKKEFEGEGNEVIQKIWEELGDNIEDDILKRAFTSNYGNITDDIAERFMEGVKLICTMHLSKESVVIRNGNKTQRETRYSWVDNAMTRYEVREDKLSK